ncbi:MAG: LuxR C-terminal-related transcriptional regulator [Oscillospiraceae bacterium]|jgi:LuxR family maltose regulon positive regulatory protein|nr:LuxR C-terminal-related transcriptional regulator [Oscillospiraceae bacterium]
MPPFTPDLTECLPRPRLNELLADAVKYPLTIVRAGTGCGKTRAVLDFTRACPLPSAWMQLSEHDNAGSRFWAKYVKLLAGWNADFAQQCTERGFPDTQDKINRHLDMRRRGAPKRPRLIVIDDLHFINHRDVLCFLERGLRDCVENTSVILICRDLPDINLSDRQTRGLIRTVTEEDLNFTENEFARYLGKQGLSIPRQNLQEIHADTGGWAFSVSLVAHSLKRAPGYAGYARTAIRRNIYSLMETEVFSPMSQGLRRFLVRVSLIDHLSADLIDELAGGNADILSELRRQNACIRFDECINAFLIHHLFLEFLRTKEDILSREEVTGTYRAAARWCARNGFESDALRYLEKVGDYENIVAVLSALPVQMPHDIALQAADILESAPEGLSERIFGFAVMHVRTVVRLCRFQKAVSLMRAYEERFLRLPEEDPFRSRTLALIYYSWGNIRALMCTADGLYDFDAYYAKMGECMVKAPVKPDQYADMPIGFWASLAGDSPRTYIKSAERAETHITRCWAGAAAGISALCRGELCFYRGDMKSAEPLFFDALAKAREHRQFEIENKALFYLMRLALYRGKRRNAERFLREAEARLSEKSYSHRFLNCDAAYAWYYCALHMPEKVPVWLTENFSPYSHAYYIENTANQLKARFHYLTGNYAPLLAYIGEMKRRESVLYGRVEMLATEACAHYKMKDADSALDALRVAHKEAGDMLTPFAELGKDMRTLAAHALRHSGIDPGWLETVRRKAACFAKLQSEMRGEFETARGGARALTLSPREREVLGDLCRGLSRAEIAAKQSLSVNTVNSSIGSIFGKLGAHNTADAVRIAASAGII